MADTTYIPGEDSFVSIATKTSPSFAARFEMICMKKGINKYQAIQMMLDCFIRYTDDRHNLTMEMEQAMSMFEHMSGWDKALNLADPTTRKEVCEATYYLIDPTGKKHGTRAVHVRFPFFGSWSEDVNIQHILDRTLKLLTPERHQRLWHIAREEDCSTLLELLDRMIDHFLKEEDLKELREPFEDNDRHEWGNKPHSGAPYKRKKSKSIDNQEFDFDQNNGKTNHNPE